MTIPLMDIKANYTQVKKRIVEKLDELIDSTSFIGGKEVDLFEKEFAEYNGTKYCVGCSNGTDAITIALKALGVGHGDTVLVPANSFIATPEAATSLGADVDFIDVDETYYTINPDLIEDYILKNSQKKVKAVIPVHIYGQMADMVSLKMLSEKYNFFIVEDAAQAQGARFQGKGPGIWGDIATYSFYPGKNLGAFGDAGAITTNNEKIASVCKMLTNHGRLPGEKYSHTIEGYNHRLDTIQAAILRIKLEFLEEWNNKRRGIAEEYSNALNGFVFLPEVRKDVLPVWYVYTIQVDDRSEFIENVKDIFQTGIYYPTILPKLEAYKQHNNKNFVISEMQSKKIISLPMFPELKDNYNFDDIIGKIKKYTADKK